MPQTLPITLLMVAVVVAGAPVRPVQAPTPGSELETVPFGAGVELHYLDRGTGEPVIVRVGVGRLPPDRAGRRAPTTAARGSRRQSGGAVSAGGEVRGLSAGGRPRTAQ